MDWGGKNIKICEHPLGIQVNNLWDKLLPMFGYDKDVNVMSIPKKRYDDICKLIDAQVSPWFEPFREYHHFSGSNTLPNDNKEYRNLLNAWDYRARHLS